MKMFAGQRSSFYLQGGAVVAAEALVLERDVDALLGPEVHSGTGAALLQVEHVLLQPSRSFGEHLEVGPLLGAGDDTGGKD